MGFLSILAACCEKRLHKKNGACYLKKGGGHSNLCQDSRAAIDYIEKIGGIEVIISRQMVVNLPRFSEVFPGIISDSEGSLAHLDQHTTRIVLSFLAFVDFLGFFSPCKDLLVFCAVLPSFPRS